MRPLAFSFVVSSLFVAAVGPANAGDAPTADASQSAALKDCMDKQQASNTTNLTHEQMLQACQDQLRAIKATMPAAMSKATMRRSRAGQPARQEQRDAREQRP